MNKEVLRSFDVLKLSTSILDTDTGEKFILSLPSSRIKRNFKNLKVNEALTGFQNQLQMQYNSCPVGQFAGPYDQNEALPLNIQLPDADLDFDQYTQFRHPDNVNCRGFAIKDSYQQIKDLDKIDALKVKDNNDTSEEEDNESEEQMVFTCQKKQCRLPCPCSSCCGEDQCPDHKIRHEEVFDNENDVVAIRSKDEFCTDQTFFDRGYLIKYPGIPLHCKRCKRNVLHHICYHFDLHENCKFCRKEKYKTSATTVSEFEENINKHNYFLKYVCPHCDNKFCKPHFR